jgi:hypothetical protein
MLFGGQSELVVELIRMASLDAHFNWIAQSSDKFQKILLQDLGIT